MISLEYKSCIIYLVKVVEFCVIFIYIVIEILKENIQWIDYRLIHCILKSAMLTYSLN